MVREVWPLALRDEDTRTLALAWLLMAEVMTLEYELSDLVNAAYRLTHAEIELMLDTTLPRMPLRRGMSKSLYRRMPID